MTAVAYQDSPPSGQGRSHVRAPRPAEWDGISHARLTRRMTQAHLSPSARVVMAEIFRCIPVGSWRHISHATLARRLGLSESTVSTAMGLLAGETLDAAGLPVNRTPFISRRRSQGRRGYEICPLPPPELRPRPAPRPQPTEEPPEPAAITQTGFFDPVITDPHDPIPLGGVPTPQTDDAEGSLSDPCIFLDHAGSGGSGRSALSGEPDPASAPPADPAAPPPAPAPVPPPAAVPLPDAMPPALGRLGLLAHQWPALRRAAAPHAYGLAELMRDLRKLRTRRDRLHSPFAIIVTALRDRAPIFDQAEIDAQAAEVAALLAPREEIPDAPARPRARAARAVAQPARPAAQPPAGPPPGLKLARVRPGPDGGEPPPVPPLRE